MPHAAATVSFLQASSKEPKVKDLLEKAKSLEEKLSDIEKELYQTQNKSGQDPLNFPIKLTNKLGHLNALVGMGDFAPTEQDVAVKNELTQKIEKQLTAFNKLLDEEVAAFNNAFKHSFQQQL